MPPAKGIARQLIARGVENLGVRKSEGGERR